MGSRAVVIACADEDAVRQIFGVVGEGNGICYTRTGRRLRARHLGTKRSLALREFALGMEGLQRFVDREPLRRVHECVFAVLALESEPVDPRL